MSICPYCQSAADEGASFCTVCGNPLSAAHSRCCSQCGKPVGAEDVFCECCGQRLDAPGATAASASPASPVAPAASAYRQPIGETVQMPRVSQAGKGAAPAVSETTSQLAAPQKRSKAPLIACVAVLAAALVGAGAYALVGQHQAQQEKLEAAQAEADEAKDAAEAAQKEKEEAEAAKAEAEAALADAEAEKKEAEATKEKEAAEIEARHIVTDAWELYLPAAWSGRVSWSQSGDTITVYSKEYPDYDLVRIMTTSYSTESYGDVGSACMGEISLGNGRHAQIWATRWAYIIGEDSIRGEVYSPNGFASQECAEEVTNLQTGGSTTYLSVLHAMQDGAGADEYTKIDDYLKANIVSKITVR